jgi:hypothetical protein
LGTRRIDGHARYRQNKSKRKSGEGDLRHQRSFSDAGIVRVPDRDVKSRRVKS